jgi:hypothetical protein
MHLPERREVRAIAKAETVSHRGGIASAVVVGGRGAAGVGLWGAELAGCLCVKVVVPINDNDVERCRRCDRGEHSFKEVPPRGI